VSGTCECVGFLGPLLGGGHGFIQGYHGLAADGLIEARVILSNGSIITASNTSNTDLFWGLRGAGHNFGIVTEVTFKIYDVPDGDIWYYETFTYSADSIELVFNQLNEVRDETPVEFEHYSLFFRSPDIDPVNVSGKN
jgi:FAD/FMN-containing dehydrogenase